MKRFNLDDKIAIVTGGAGFYGEPISEALAEAGATVIIASRNFEKCSELANQLTSRGYKADAFFLDLSQEASILAFVSNVVKKYHRIDILVNNAVSRAGFKNLDDVSKEELESAQTINATGMMLITKAVVAQMKHQLSGNIINIGSIQGMGGPNFPVYGNTGMTSPVNYTYDKWGIIGFTKWVANFYAPFNIRANCISPGGFGPGLSEKKGIEEFVENYKRLTPLGRFAEAEDIKGAIIFLASEASSYITGHNLPIDGGWSNW